MIFAQCNGTIKLEQILIAKEEVEKAVVAVSTTMYHTLKVHDSIHKTVSYTGGERGGDLQNLPLITAHTAAVVLAPMGEYETL